MKQLRSPACDHRTRFKMKHLVMNIFDELVGAQGPCSLAGPRNVNPLWSQIGSHPVCSPPSCLYTFHFTSSNYRIQVRTGDVGGRTDTQRGHNTQKRRVSRGLSSVKSSIKQDIYACKRVLMECVLFAKPHKPKAVSHHPVHRRSVSPLFTYTMGVEEKTCQTSISAHPDRPAEARRPHRVEIITALSAARVPPKGLSGIGVKSVQIPAPHKSMLRHCRGNMTARETGISEEMAIHSRAPRTSWSSARLEICGSGREHSNGRQLYRYDSMK